MSASGPSSAMKRGVQGRSGNGLGVSFVAAPLAAAGADAAWQAVRDAAMSVNARAPGLLSLIDGETARETALRIAGDSRAGLFSAYAVLATLCGHLGLPRAGTQPPLTAAQFDDASPDRRAKECVNGEACACDCFYCWVFLRALQRTARRHLGCRASDLCIGVNLWQS